MHLCTLMHTLFYCTAIFAQTFSLEVAFNRARRIEKDEQVSGILLMCVCALVCVCERECTNTQNQCHSTVAIKLQHYTLGFVFFFTKGKKNSITVKSHRGKLKIFLQNAF